MRCRVLMIAIFSIFAPACSTLVVRPEVLYEDGALYQKIQKEKGSLEGKETPKVKDVNTLLNHYDTYTQKAHIAIQKNNKRAVG